jgi:putative membrane protein
MWGALVNNSRNFAIKLSAILHDEKIINTFENDSRLCFHFT